MPHGVPSVGARLREGPHIALTLMRVHGYCAECERTAFVVPPSAELQAAFAAMIEARSRAFALARPGVACAEIDAAANEPIKDFVFGIGIFNSQGISCYGTNTNLEDYEPVVLQGEGKAACRIEKLNLINGTYYLDVAVHKRDGYPFDYHHFQYSFHVTSSHRDVGIARIPHRWEFSDNITFTKNENS